MVHGLRSRAVSSILRCRERAGTSPGYGRIGQAAPCQGPLLAGGGLGRCQGHRDPAVDARPLATALGRPPPASRATPGCGRRPRRRPPRRPAPPPRKPVPASPAPAPAWSERWCRRAPRPRRAAPGRRPSRVANRVPDPGRCAPARWRRPGRRRSGSSRPAPTGKPCRRSRARVTPRAVSRQRDGGGAEFIPRRPRLFRAPHSALVKRRPRRSRPARPHSRRSASAGTPR
jgi:hypothetical protein